MEPMEWLMSDDTGVSSKSIFSVMTKTKTNSMHVDVPHDPSDFGRCYRLLKLFPAWRNRLTEVADAMPMWGPMVSAWAELEALYERELENESGRAPDTYVRIRELVDAGRLAANCQ